MAPVEALARPGRGRAIGSEPAAGAPRTGAYARRGRPLFAPATPRHRWALVAAALAAAGGVSAGPGCRREPPPAAPIAAPEPPPTVAPAAAPAAPASAPAVPVETPATAAPEASPPRPSIPVDRLFAGRTAAWWEERLRQLALRTDAEGRALYDATRLRAERLGLEVTQEDGAVALTAGDELARTLREETNPGAPP